MSVMVVESTDLGTPYQCPMCRRLFYFDNDYTRHKCSARERKIKNLNRKIMALENIKVRRKRK